MEVEVQLCITSASGHIVVDGHGRLPSKPLIDDSKDVASELYRELFAIYAEPWLIVRQVGFVDLSATRKVVLYAVEQPSPVCIRNRTVYEWKPIDSVLYDGPCEAAPMLIRSLNFCGVINAS